MKTARNRLVMVLMFSCGVAASAGLLPAQAKDKGLATALTYSVPLVGNPDQFNDRVSTCTGTMIGKNAILTATHCLEGDNKVVKVRGTILEYIFRVDDGKDNTLLFFADNTFDKRKYPQICKDVRYGDDVVSVGNPLFFNNIVRKGYYSGDGVINNSNYMLFDMNHINGDSGSGLFTDSGCIVGVLQGVYNVFYQGSFFKMSASARMEFTKAQFMLVQK